MATPPRPPPSRKSPPSARRKEAGSQRAHLLRTALAVFGEAGYQAASMRDVAKRAGITQAAIYYYFESKEDILLDIINNFSDHVLNSLMAVLAQPLEPTDKLAKLLTTQVDMVAANRKELKLLFEDKHQLSADRLRLIQDKEKAVFNVYRACLIEMRRARMLTDVDPTVAAFNLLGAVNWLYHWYRENGPLKFDVIRASTIKFVLFGVCARKPKLPGGRAAGRGKTKTRTKK